MKKKSPPAKPPRYKPGAHHLDKRAEALIEMDAVKDGEELIDAKKLATELGVTAQWLSIGRTNGYGPKFIKYTSRVMYRRSDVRAWLRSRTFTTTAEYAASKAAAR